MNDDKYRMQVLNAHYILERSKGYLKPWHECTRMMAQLDKEYNLLVREKVNVAK